MKRLLLVTVLGLACHSGRSILALDVALDPAGLAVRTVAVEVRQGPRSIVTRDFAWNPDKPGLGVYLPGDVSGPVDTLARGLDERGRVLAEGQAQGTVTPGKTSDAVPLVLRAVIAAAPDGGPPDAAPPDLAPVDATPPSDHPPAADRAAPDVLPDEVPLPPPVDSPRPIRPSAGEATGSVHAPASLRPRFRWAAVAGATSYEIQLDDSCPPGAACTFPSPEIDATVAEASFTPASPLAVSTAPPVGRRYAWRVRGCNQGGCGPWSAARAVDVGRQLRDYDGDGYADVLVSGEGGGSVILMFRGGPTLDAKADLEIRFQDEPGQLVAVGDVNGDGFPDWVAAFPPAHVVLYLGGRTPHTAPDVALTRPPPGPMDDFFGDSAAAAGDVDGDGFADFLIYAGSQPGGKPAAAYLYRGGSRLDGRPSATVDLGAPGEGFGGAMAAGDVNGDGLSDVLIANHSETHLFLGGGPFDTTSDLVYPSFPRFVNGLAATDMNGDGFAEVVVAAGTGIPVVYPGAARPGTTGIPLARGGDEVAAGDVDADGFGDVMIGKSFEGAFLYLGADAIVTSPALVLTPQLTRESFGESVSFVGDMDGDGLGELLVGASNPRSNPDLTTGSVYLFRGGKPTDATPDLVLHGTRDADFIGRTLALLGRSARPGWGGW